MTSVAPTIPTGMVTFLLTDVAGSTRAWHVSPERMMAAITALDAGQRIAEERVDAYIVTEAWLARAAATLEGDTDVVDHVMRYAAEHPEPLLLWAAELIQLLIAARHHDVAVAERSYAEVVRLAAVHDERHTLTQATGFLARAYGNDTARALPLLRQALTDFAAAGMWAQHTMLMREALRHLLLSGRTRSAALVLGAVRNAVADLSERLIVRATSQLEEALGADFEPLVREGQRMSRPAIVRLVVDEIDSMSTTSSFV